jgi:hypothetical protein
VPVTLKLPPRTAELLRKYARSSGLTIGAIVTGALNAFLQTRRLRGTYPSSLLQHHTFFAIGVFVAHVVSQFEEVVAVLKLSSSCEVSNIAQTRFSSLE